MVIYLFYLVVGLLTYWPVMRAWFYGDDWMFLTVVSQASSALVAFAPLNQRFTRPISVLTYYWNYQLFELWTFPAHLFIVLLHVFTTCLVHRLVLRIVPQPNKLIAFGAGLVFLLFAGHSEAVSWTAGMADVVATAFMIGSLLLLAGALEPETTGYGRLALAIVVGAGGLLGKEVAMVVPALGAAYGVLPIGDARVTRQRLTRTAIFAVTTGMVTVAYLLFRSLRFSSGFGSALGGYSGLGTSEGQFIAVARMFVLRLIVPPGRVAASLWTHNLDLVVFAVAAAAIAWVMFRDPRSRAGLAFAGAALLVTLAPALPLSISLVNSLSERYIYAASVFSTIIAVWVIARTVRHQALVVAAIVLLAGMNVRSLERANRRWVAGPTLFRTVVDGLAALQREHDPHSRSLIVLLNLPDNLDRPYVNGAGVLPALHLLSPADPLPDARVRIVGTHSADLKSGLVRVSRNGRTFTIDVGEDAVVPGWAKDTDEYTVVQDGPHRYAVTIRPTKRRALIAYVSDAQVQLAAELNGAPFGSIDLPGGDIRCDGAATRFAGWAIDDEGVEDVVLMREPSGTGQPEQAGVIIGTATWHTGRRPDVAAAFQDYPSAERAEWDFELPCAVVRQAGEPLRIRVVARDRHDQRTDLGTRTVR